MSTQILVTTPGAISEQDKATLRDSGVVVVETDNVANVRLLDAEVPAINANGLLWAAVHAITYSGSALAHNAFVKNVAAIITKPEAKA